jgi:hypothetical protein
MIKLIISPTIVSSNHDLDQIIDLNSLGKKINENNNQRKIKYKTQNDLDRNQNTCIVQLQKS